MELFSWTIFNPLIEREEDELKFQNLTQITSSYKMKRCSIKIRKLKKKATLIQFINIIFLYVFTEKKKLRNIH